MFFIILAGLIVYGSDGGFPTPAAHARATPPSAAGIRKPSQKLTFQYEPFRNSRHDWDAIGISHHLKLKAWLPHDACGKALSGIFR
jgi:hypothetical protein